MLRPQPVQLPHHDLVTSTEMVQLRTAYPGPTDPLVRVDPFAPRSFQLTDLQIGILIRQTDPGISSYERCGD